MRKGILKMKSFRKRFFSILITSIMVLGLVLQTAFGATNDTIVTFDLKLPSTLSYPQEITITVYSTTDDTEPDYSNVVFTTTTNALSPESTFSLGTADSDYFYWAQVEIPKLGKTVDLGPVEPIELPGLIWQDSTTNSPFGTANDFNVFSFGNFNASNADVEGGLAVRGNFSSIERSGYLIGMPATHKDTQSTSGWWGPTGSEYPIGNPIKPHSPRLIVGGSIEIEDLLVVVGGSVYVTDTEDIAFTNNGTNEIHVYEYIGGNTKYDNSSNKNTDFNNHIWTSTDGSTDYVKQYSEIDDFFADAYSHLNQLSQNYASKTSTSSDTLVINVTATDVINLPGRTLKLTPDTDASLYDTIVYNVIVETVGDIAPLGNVEIDMDNFNGNIIINMVTDGDSDTVNFCYNNYDAATGGGGIRIKDDYREIYTVAKQYADRIFWNFPSNTIGEIKTINSEAYQFMGSMLAPNSDFIVLPNISRIGNVNGCLIANNIDVSGGNAWEAHNIVKYLGPVQSNVNQFEAKFTLIVEAEPSSPGPGTTPETNKGIIVITKKVVDTLGVAYNVNDTFKIGIFTDKSGSTPYKSFQTVTLNNESSKSITFDELPIGVYYVYEIDENNKAILEGGKVNEIYEVTYSETYISINDNTTKEITIENKTVSSTSTIIPEEVDDKDISKDQPTNEHLVLEDDIPLPIVGTSINTLTPNTNYDAPATGDNNQLILYISLLIISIFLLIVFRRSTFFVK